MIGAVDEGCGAFFVGDESFCGEDVAGVGVFTGDDDEDAAAEAGFVCLAQAGDAVDDAAVG